MRIVSFVFLCLSVCSSIGVFGQDVAKLKKDLAIAKEDTMHLKILSELHWALVYENKNEAKAFAQQELALSIKLKSRKWEAQAYNDLGIVAMVETNFREALRWHQKALKIRTDLGDLEGIGSSQLKIGMNHIELGELDKGLDAELKALLLMQKTGNKQGIAYALTNICGVLDEQKQYQNMGKYAQESYLICKEIGDSPGMANASNFWAMWLENQNKTKEAEQKFQEALAIFSSSADTLRMAAVLNNLGHLKRMGDPATALPFYEKALYLAIHHSIQDTSSIVGYATNVANRYNLQKKFHLAETTLRKALHMAQKAKLIRVLPQIYSTLSDIFAQTEKADSAVKYAEYFQNSVEQKFSAEMASNFSKLQTQFEIDIREQQKATLAKENDLKAQKLIRYQILIGALLVVISLVILIFWLIRNQQKIILKRQIDEERWQQQEARTKAVIEAEERERQRIARELHDGVGQQLSAARLHLSALEGKFGTHQSNEEALLSTAISMMDDAVKEVRSVAHTMLANALLKQGLAGAVRDFIQKINSSGLIKIELEISGLDQKLDPTMESMLFRIIQEMMSNIIRHSSANQVTIQLHRQEKELVLMVEDNGVGFDPDLVSGGAGMQNMKSRVAYINGTFEVDSSPGRGTTISVEVKL